MTKERVGLALGSGSARGLAHIGVIRALLEAGVAPDIVCGSSMGAIVGAAYVAGGLDDLEAWARSLDALAVARYFDINWLGHGGPIKGEQLQTFLEQMLPDVDMADLPIDFGVVATALRTGAAVWLREGPLIPAVRASSALPGLLPPVQLDDRWLVDGGLIDPVPVALCRAMGADTVIAVNLNADLVGADAAGDSGASGIVDALPLADQLPQVIRDGMDTLVAGLVHREPRYLDVVVNSIKIMQYQIANIRLVEAPPDLLLAPRLGHIGLLAFGEAAEIIDEGARAVARTPLAG